MKNMKLIKILIQRQKLIKKESKKQKDEKIAKMTMTNFCMKKI